MIENTQLRKLAVATLAIATLIIVGWVIFQSISRQGKVEVKLLIAPNDATVVVDGRYVSGDSVYLAPGTHTYEIKRADFITKTGEIDVKDNNQTQYIGTGLMPSNAKGEATFEARSAEYGANDDKSSEIENENGIVFKEKNPIVNMLPYSSMLYTLGYRLDPSDKSGNSIIIEVDAPVYYQQNAVVQIRNFGFDPVDFNINFKNEENPFENEA